MVSVEDKDSAAKPFARPSGSRADAHAAQRRGVGARMLLAVIFGAIFGYVLSLVIAPSFGPALAIGGALSFGAIAVALFLQRANAPEEQSNDGARTRVENVEAVEK
jgi:hypothetical protein